MVELETESDYEDIIDVVKNTIEKENVKIMIIRMKEANLRAYQIKRLLYWRHNSYGSPKRSC